jgi:hypothetical protein
VVWCFVVLNTSRLPNEQISSSKSTVVAALKAGRDFESTEKLTDSGGCHPLKVIFTVSVVPHLLGIMPGLGRLDCLGRLAPWRDARAGSEGERGQPQSRAWFLCWARCARFSRFTVLNNCLVRERVGPNFKRDRKVELGGAMPHNPSAFPSVTSACRRSKWKFFDKLRHQRSESGTNEPRADIQPHIVLSVKGRAAIRGLPDMPTGQFRKKTELPTVEKAAQPQLVNKKWCFNLSPFVRLREIQTGLQGSKYQRRSRNVCYAALHPR